jgi:ElaB/YqjD/DUF883 family membrane-anchored ribosome-binding protein
VTQPSKPSQTTKQKEASKSAQEIENEISTTRGAISDDIRALSDKFSAQNIKQEAKNAAKDAASSVAQAASEKASEVKDNVMEKANEIKDVVTEKAVAIKDTATEKAVELRDEASEKLAEARDAVVETYDEVSEQAMRLGGEVWRFTAANAVPLALVGVGAGWLIANSRRTQTDYPRRYSTDGARRLSADYQYEDEPEWDERSGTMRPRRMTGSTRSTARPRAKATGLAHQAGDAARNAGHKIEETASQGADALKRSAAQSGAYLRENFDKARMATRSFAEENPIALAVATLVAGVGVGMLLPTSERETKLLTPARQKIDSWLGDAREAASDVANVAKQTARETLHASH